MKNLIASLTLASISCFATAQEIQSPERHTQKIRKHEIGLTTETDVFSNDLNSTTFQALQFKKWKNEHYGARFLLGHSQLQSDVNHPVTYTTQNDTITKRIPLTNARLGIVGVGLEAQRQFYKRIYMFAAVEGRFGFGKATTQDIVERVDKNGQYISYTHANFPVRTQYTSDVFYAGLTPSFGAKFQFSRITFGSEMAWNILNYTNIDGPTGSHSSFDMDMSRLNPRFFIHYRF